MPESVRRRCYPPTDDVLLAAPVTRGNPTVIQKLYGRFQDLQAATAEHSSLLSTSLDDTGSALNLVKAQLGSLLASGGDDDEDDD